MLTGDTLLVKYTKHAEEQLLERSFLAKEVEDAIKRGTKYRQNGKFVSEYKDYRVVYKQKNDIYYVITVMYRW